MKVTFPIIGIGLALALMMLSQPGCAGFGTLRQAVGRNTSEDVGATRQTRKEALAHEFDHKRDDAQFDAAASCWQRGDEESCRRLLDQLLERNPNHRRGRLLLADLYLFKGQSEQSIAELNKAVAVDPKDALAHHSLAQVLDASGRRPEALAHYKLAAGLEPTNDVYAQSYKMSLDLSPTMRPNELLAATNARPITPGTAIQESGNQAPPRLFAEPASPNEWVRPIDFSLARDPQPATGTAAPAIFASPELNNTAERSQFASSATVPPGPGSVQLASWNAPENAPPTMSPRPSSPTVMPVVSTPALATDANPQNWHNPLERAVKALAEGDTQTAVDAASRGLSQTPDQAAALYRVLGAAHYRRAEYQAAQAALAQALSLDKSDALAYFLMGATLDKSNRPDAAARYYAEAARRDARFGN